MERRKIILGSGAALATVLAGCSSADGDEGDPKGDDGKGDAEKGDGDRDDGKGGDEKGDGKGDDIPGFGEEEFSLEKDHVEVRRVERKGNAVEVVLRTTILSEDDLEEHFGDLSEKVADAIHDPEAFAAEIDTVYGTIVDADGTELITFRVEVAWVLDYANGELAAEELVNRVLETVD